MVTRSVTLLVIIFFSLAQLFDVKDEEYDDVRTPAQIEADVEVQAMGFLGPDMAPEDFDTLEQQIQCLKDNAPGCLIPPHPIPLEVIDRVLTKLLPQARHVYETQGPDGFDIWYELRMTQAEYALEDAYSETKTKEK